MKKVTLSITPAENQPGHYVVAIRGEGFFESVGNTVGARIRGEDEFVDDQLFGIGGTGFEKVHVDGSFHLSQIVHSSVINEDWGKDEIYALVEVEGLSGTFRTNTVKGDF